jgi:hypothetical protein
MFLDGKVSVVCGMLLLSAMAGHSANAQNAMNFGRVALGTTSGVQTLTFTVAAGGALGTAGDYKGNGRTGFRGWGHGELQSSEKSYKIAIHELRERLQCPFIQIGTRIRNGVSQER